MNTKNDDISEILDDVFTTFLSIPENLKRIFNIFDTALNNGYLLAQDVIEIERIKQGMKQKYPTDNADLIAEKTAEKIEKENPTLKQKLIDAFRGGVLEALKTNPFGAAFVGIVEGWSEKN